MTDNTIGILETPPYPLDLRKKRIQEEACKAEKETQVLATIALIFKRISPNETKKIYEKGKAIDDIKKTWGEEAFEAAMKRLEKIEFVKKATVTMSEGEKTIYIKNDKFQALAELDQKSKHRLCSILAVPFYRAFKRYRDLESVAALERFGDLDGSVTPEKIDDIALQQAIAFFAVGGYTI